MADAPKNDDSTPLAFVRRLFGSAGTNPLGRDVTTLVAFAQRLFKASEEAARFDNVARVLARTRLSDYEPYQTVRGLDRCAEELLELRRILFYRIATQTPEYATDRLVKACSSLYDVLAQENEPARAEPLPRLDARKLDAQDFYRRFVLRPQAVVIENWDFEPARFRFDELMRNFGDEPQPLIRSDGSHYEGPLTDLLHEETYLPNSDRLLTKHPELIGDLGADRFQKLVQLTYMSSQLFVGDNYGGSAAHFADACTSFFQIEGKKKWTLVDPAFSYLTYTVMHPAEGHNALFWMDEDDAKRCPLFRFCPRYEVVLKPGDVLFFPWYWTHSVVNSKRSVGVAVRWVGRPPGDFQSPCDLFDIGRKLSARCLEHELTFMLAMFAEAPTNWFEGKVHGRTYKYDAELIARAWGVSPVTIAQKPGFR